MKTSALSLLLLLFFGSCENEVDSHYDRPDWLEGSVYSILEEKGNFSMYLEAVDSTLYSRVLNGAGNYTVFAPNDAAFTKFLAEKGYTNVRQIPKEELTKIIGYSLVYNKFESSRLGDVLKSSEWIVGNSIKKNTAYYKTIYQEQVNGKTEWVVDNLKEATAVVTPYKYLPIFTNTYFQTNGLNSSDYTHFYPNTNFSGLNIPGGSVLAKDIHAMNGVIHEVDAVPYPLENIDEVLKHEENSMFKSLLDYQTDGTYLFASYQEYKALTEVYKDLYPDRNINSLYVKKYAGLVYSPNIEEYTMSGSTFNSEEQGYTLFVPSNEAMSEFINNKLLKYANSISDLPTDVLTNFIKAHQADIMVWPSKYKVAQNGNSEFFNAAGSTGPSFEEDGITGKYVASNGFVYNIDHVIKSRYFETVYSEILLNPEYTWINALLNNTLTSLRDELMKSSITGELDHNVNIVIPSNALLAADGYDYNEIDKTYTNSNVLGTITKDDRIRRLLRSGIFMRVKNEDINAEIVDFSGSPELGYDGFGYAVNDYGDMVRFKDNKLQAMGNILSNEWVEVTELATLNNGKVFSMDGLLQYSPRTTDPSNVAGWEERRLYTTISEYVAQNPDASLFKNYLDKTLHGVDSNGNPVLTGISNSGFYTVLVPQNDQMEQAIADKVLPALANVTDANIAAKKQASDFISACFLTGTVLPDDGVPAVMPGNYANYTISTVYKVNEPSLDLIAEKTSMEVTKPGGILKFAPKSITEGNTVKVEGINEATVIRGITKSNYMGARSVIHAIDKYLAFKAHVQ
ncbi:fasciclin domain-containing protein [Bacteroides sp. 214]|uniref:fasciclin domain-containing protein n=1 Tax=Bacteroides sp. 214 TaxID=2302935 RepID=UPI0013D4D948|nr:fasciclin domain-containing protein [Bacteroides sp. 214]